MKSVNHFVILAILMITLHAVPTRSLEEINIFEAAKRPRLEISSPFSAATRIPPDSLGTILRYSKITFKKLVESIRGSRFEEGQSMMPSDKDIFPALRYHDAAQDDNFALRNWFDLEASPEKLEQLKILVSNPTVDFLIEDKLVLKQASQFGDLEVIKQIVKGGISPTSEAVIQASKYGHENLVEFYLDHKYWNRSGLVYLAANCGDLGLVKMLKDIPEYANAFSQTGIVYTFGWACASGNLELVQYLSPFLNMFPRVYHYSISQQCADGGNIELVEYIQKQNILGFSADRVIDVAAYQGSLDFFKSILGILPSAPKNDTIYAAMRGGNFKVFKFLEDHDVFSSFKTQIPIAFNLVCREGNLEFITYLLEKYSCKPDSVSLEESIAGGNIDLATFFIEEYNLGSKRSLDRLLKKRGIGYKADRMYFDFLNYLSSKFNFEYGEADLQIAVENGKYFFARYLLSEQNIIPHKDIFEKASSKEDQRLMRHLSQKYGFAPSVELLVNAVKAENFDEIIWLTRNGVVPDQHVWHYAIQAMDADFYVQYFVNELKSAPYLITLNLACKLGKLRLVKMFIQNHNLRPNCRTMRDAVLEKCLHGGNEEVIDYLVSVNNNLRESIDEYVAEFSQYSQAQLHSIYMHPKSLAPYHEPLCSIL